MFSIILSFKSSHTCSSKSGIKVYSNWPLKWHLEKHWKPKKLKSNKILKIQKYLAYCQHCKIWNFSITFRGKSGMKVYFMPSKLFFADKTKAL